MNIWDKRFLDLAKHVSLWSKDPSTKVGAVISDGKNRIVSVGYNGFPVGISDLDERLENRKLKYEYIVHAEINCILFANKSLDGCTLYTYPMFPCSRCCSQIIQSGISKVISVEIDNIRWAESIELSKSMLKEAGIEFYFYKE
jgi:dCMP deaminase